jgi:site-specific DNA-methyltransferase (adenine-specific)
MSRVEVIGDATLYLGDALGVLQSHPSFRARALVSDPPYCSGGFTEAAKRSAKGQGLRSETLREGEWFGGDNMTSAGLQWLLRAVAVAFKGHALDDGCTASFFCDWRMVPLLATAIESAGLRFQSMPIWDKQAVGLGTGFRAQHECILHFAIGGPRYHSKSHGNVLRAPRVSADRDHPTEKPVSLMAKIIDVQAEPGTLVLDPFMGSGSTGVAAVMNGRSFVGIEHDPGHFETACRRLAHAQGLGAHSAGRRSHKGLEAAGPLFGEDA